MPDAFARYIALGDSISIDLYPALDAAGVDGWADERRLRTGLGAASLLYRNDDALWPEFRGRDLATRSPGIAFRRAGVLGGPAGDTGGADNLTADGATIADVLEHQLPEVERDDEPTLVTLTAGGNDLLGAMHRAPWRDPSAALLRALGEVLRAIRDLRPRSLTLLGTVYDPSDGTNQLGDGVPLDEPARWLAAYNAGVRALAAGREGVRLADIHRAFLGHGLSAPAAERWYWRGSIIEPGARGASEVRRVWLEALG